MSGQQSSGGGARSVAIITGVFAVIAAVVTGFFTLAAKPDPDGTPTPPATAAPTTVVDGPDPVGPGVLRPAVPPSGPGISTSKAFVRPGEVFTVSGSGFPGNEQVVLQWSLPSGTLDVGVLDLSPAGAFSTRVTVPAGLCDSNGAFTATSAPTYEVHQIPLRVQGAGC